MSMFLFWLKRKEDNHDRCNINIRVRREAAQKERHPTRIVPWLRCRHSQYRGDMKAAVGWKGTWHCPFFSTSTFLLYMPRPLLLSKLWPVRPISTRNSPQSRTFSCPMIHGGIDPVGVVRDRPLEK